jgi:uncharacterized membrane protein (UPF0127 family)
VLIANGAYQIIDSHAASYSWHEFQVAGRRLCLPTADTPAARARGLMGVSHPVPMVFVFDPPLRASFWMKGTPEPLTGVWVSATTGRVVGYWHGAPESLVNHVAPQAVRYVIEYPRDWSPPALGTTVRRASPRICPAGARL